MLSDLLPTIQGSVRIMASINIFYVRNWFTNQIYSQPGSVEVIIFVVLHFETKKTHWPHLVKYFKSSMILICPA